MNFDNKVWEACKKIPKGKVSTYQEIAKFLDSKAYRAIGQALKRNPYAPKVPCHRVVKTNGTIGGFMGKTKGSEITKKINILSKEGISVKNNNIENFEKVLFKF